MIEELNTVDVFAPVSNNELNTVVGGSWKSFWRSLRSGFYDGEKGIFHG